MVYIVYAGREICSFFFSAQGFTDVSVRCQIQIHVGQYVVILLFSFQGCKGTLVGPLSQCIVYIVCDCLQAQHLKGIRIGVN